MTVHSVLFNAIVDREMSPRTVFPRLFSSSSSSTYRGGIERGHSPLTRPASTHSGSGSLSPLISIYTPSSSSSSSPTSPSILDIPYDTDSWGPTWQTDDREYMVHWNSILHSMPNDSPPLSYSESSPSASPISPHPPSPHMAMADTTGTSPADLPARPKKECSHCHATSTPLWRRDPTTKRPLCNACGLYLQTRGCLRPQALIDADIDSECEHEIPDAEYKGPKCSHCGTRQTSVWRKTKEGSKVCNACGVYERLRGRERPLELRRNKIKPRMKHPKQP